MVYSIFLLHLEFARQTFEGESDESPDIIPGDIVFTLRQVPHPTFVRQGHNLYAKEAINLIEVRSSCLHWASGYLSHDLNFFFFFSTHASFHLSPIFISRRTGLDGFREEYHSPRWCHRDSQARGCCDATRVCTDCRWPGDATL